MTLPTTAQAHTTHTQGPAHGGQPPSMTILAQTMAKYAVRRGAGSVVHTVKRIDRDGENALLYCHERVRLAHIDLMREPKDGLPMCRSCEKESPVALRAAAEAEGFDVLTIHWTARVLLPPQTPLFK